MGAKLGTELIDMAVTLEMFLPYHHFSGPLSRKKVMRPVAV
jgi:hypothetical protein